MEIFFCISLGSILNPPFSISQKTTFPPAKVIAALVAIHEKAVVITSSPGFKPKAFIAITKASEPFAQETQCLLSFNFLKLFSNLNTSDPPIKSEFLRCCLKDLIN